MKASTPKNPPRAAEEIGSDSLAACAALMFLAQQFPHRQFDTTELSILCAGKAGAHESLCTLFDHETNHGRDMAIYSELLQKAVASVVHTFTRRAVGQLLLSRDAVLPTHQEQTTADSEFELVTWLVIKSP